MSAAAVPSPFRVPPPFVNYRLDSAYDEMFASPGPARALRALHRMLLSSRRGTAPQPAGRRSHLPPPRHHLHRLRQQRRHRAHLPQRPDAAHHHRRTNGRQIEKRPDAAHHRAESVPARHLSRRPHPHRRHRPARTDLQLQTFPPRDARHQRPARHLRQHLRHRSGPPARRQIRRAGRQSARAQRRLLHAGETARC